MIEYKFLTTWEEEQAMEINKNTRINPDSALSNLMNLITPMDEDSEIIGGNTKENEKNKIMRIDKNSNQICGMEKKEVF